MIIINNEARIHFLGGQYPAKAKGDKDPRLNYDHKTEIRLLPGANEVDDAAWEIASQNKIVKYYLETKVFEVKRGKDADVKELPPKGAIALVEETFNRELLEKWEAADTRPPVRSAIAKQIKAITPAPKAEE